MNLLATVGLAWILIFGTPLTAEIQPAGDNLWVSPNPSTVTVYQIPLDGVQTVGLLAHDYLGGAEFERLSVGDQIEWVDGMMVRHPFQVVEIHTWLWSGEGVLKSGGVQAADWQVLEQEYGGNDLVLQTCVDGGLRFWHLLPAPSGTSMEQTDISGGCIDMLVSPPAVPAPARLSQ